VKIIGGGQSWVKSPTLVILKIMIRSSKKCDLKDQRSVHPNIVLVVMMSSGVARVPCALGQETFFRPPLTKTTEFEVKNRCKSAKEAKAEHLLLSFFFFFESKRSFLLFGRSPQPPKANGDAEVIFTLFFIKIRTFKYTLV